MTAESESCESKTLLDLEFLEHQLKALRSGFVFTADADSFHGRS
jgi:hypothetical protein